jgi:hypothetical protein
MPNKVNPTLTLMTTVAQCMCFAFRYMYHLDELRPYEMERCECETL